MEGVLDSSYGSLQGPKSINLTHGPKSTADGVKEIKRAQKKHEDETSMTDRFMDLATNWWRYEM